MYQVETLRDETAQIGTKSLFDPAALFPVIKAKAQAKCPGSNAKITDSFIWQSINLYCAGYDPNNPDDSLDDRIDEAAEVICNKVSGGFPLWAGVLALGVGGVAVWYMLKSK